MARCRDMAGNDPRIKITAFEKDLPTAYTAATIAFLRTRYSGVNFVWLMGADNLATFHRWDQWRAIADMIPIAVVDRPNWRLASQASPAARYMADSYVKEAFAGLLPVLKPPAWTFLTGPLSDLSSTAIREGERRPEQLTRR